MRLFGDGKHGQSERIQTLRGPACHTTFSARRNTPLYRLKTPSHQIAMVRISRWLKGWTFRLPNGSQGSRQATITTWLARAHPARAFLLPSAAPAPAAGRIAHQAALRQAGASCSGWPLIPSPRSCLCLSSAPAPITWRIGSSTLSERAWPPFCLPLFPSDGLNLSFYAALGSLRPVAPGGSPRAPRAPMAGGSGADLWSGEEKLTFGASWYGSRMSCALAHRTLSQPPYRDWASRVGSTPP
jgi:hypothetical protein